MLELLLRLIPPGYDWKVAIKKMSYFAAKGTAAGLMYGKVGHYVGGHLTPDQMVQIQGGVAILTGALLEGLHDYLKLHFPDSPYL